MHATDDKNAVYNPKSLTKVASRAALIHIIARKKAGEQIDLPPHIREIICEHNEVSLQAQWLGYGVKIRPARMSFTVAIMVGRLDDKQILRHTDVQYFGSYFRPDGKFMEPRITKKTFLDNYGVVSEIKFKSPECNTCADMIAALSTAKMQEYLSSRPTREGKKSLHVVKQTDTYRLYQYQNGYTHGMKSLMRYFPHELVEARHFNRHCANYYTNIVRDGSKLRGIYSYADAVQFGRHRKWDVVGSLVYDNIRYVDTHELRISADIVQGEVVGLRLEENYQSWDPGLPGRGVTPEQLAKIPREYHALILNPPSISEPK